MSSMQTKYRNVTGSAEFTVIYVALSVRPLSNARGYSHILAIRVFAAGKGMVFKPFTLG